MLQKPLGTEQLTCSVKRLLRHPVYPITQCRYLQCYWCIQLFSLTLSCYILSLSFCYYVYYLRCLHGLHFRQVKHFCLSFGHGHTPTVDVVGTQTRVCMFKAVAESRHLAVYRHRRILLHWHNRWCSVIDWASAVVALLVTCRDLRVEQANA